MTAVRYLIVIFLVMMVSACSDGKQGQPVNLLPDNPENRTTVAKRYLEVLPTKDMLRAIASRAVQGFPEKDRKPFIEIMESPDIEKEADRLMLDGLVKQFTVGELNAMVTFYGSPEGQSAIKKFGPLMAAVMPQIQQKVQQDLAKNQKPPESKEQPQPQASPEPPVKKGPKTSPGKQ